MQKSRLIEILHTFSKKELRELKKWLASPFHNQRKDVIELIDYLSKNLHREVLLNKEKIFKFLYPSEPFDDSKMRQVVHFTMKALENYLAYISFLEKGDTQELYLAREYRKRNLSRQFEKSIKAIEVTQSSPKFQDDFFLYQKYELQAERYKFYNKSAKRTQTFNLQEIGDSFDLYLIASKLKQACTMLSHQVVYKTEYKYTFLQEILDHIEKNRALLELPAIGTYFFIYQTIVEPDNIQHFNNLKNQLDYSHNTLPINEMRNIYTSAINYCSKKINSGKSDFIKEAWELIKKGIENKILFDDGILNRFIFRNFIAIGITLKYFKEAEEAIHKYGQFLAKEYQENYINLSLAKLFFAKKDYDKAMQLVNQYEFKDILDNLSAKTMLLKMYYELSEFQTLESLLESMRAYLQRKKQLGSRINGYKNIVRYTKKLIKVNPYNKEQVAKLRKEIEEATPLTEKAWLLKQLDDL